jgi:hypothetical protein
MSSLIPVNSLQLHPPQLLNPPIPLPVELDGARRTDPLNVMDIPPMRT